MYWVMRGSRGAGGGGGQGVRTILYPPPKNNKWFPLKYWCRPSPSVKYVKTKKEPPLTKFSDSTHVGKRTLFEHETARLSVKCSNTFFGYPAIANAMKHLLTFLPDVPTTPLTH